MLIDASYFAAGPRRILTATQGAQSAEAAEAVRRQIASLQPGFLRDMLGREAGGEVQDYLCLLDSGEIGRDAAEDAVCSRLAEPFADYVFFHLLRNANDHATLTGVVRLKGPNSYVSPIAMQVEAWNRMVEGNRRFAEWAASRGCPIPGIEVSPCMLRTINQFNL